MFRALNAPCSYGQKRGQGGFVLFILTLALSWSPSLLSREQVQSELGLAVTSIVKLDTILEYLTKMAGDIDESNLAAMRKYKETYGAPEL